MAVEINETMSKLKRIKEGMSLLERMIRLGSKEHKVHFIENRSEYTKVKLIEDLNAYIQSSAYADLYRSGLAMVYGPESGDRVLLVLLKP